MFIGNQIQGCGLSGTIGQMVHRKPIVTIVHEKMPPPGFIISTAVASQRLSSISKSTQVTIQTPGTNHPWGPFFGHYPLNYFTN